MLARGVLVTVVLLVATAVPSLAFTPYAAGTRGFDISFPQCGTALPAGTSNQFAIVGITGGRAFSQNPCFASEYQHAATTVGGSRVAFYMNLNAAIGSSASNGLTGPKGSCGRSDKLCLAYNYGWNAADQAWQYATVPVSAGVWWLDIETANSWNAQSSLNRATIQGAVDNLTSHGQQVGIYSTPSMWNSITGTWPSNLPVWFAGTASTTCSAARAASFTQGPVWLLQHASAADNGNEAC